MTSQPPRWSEYLPVVGLQPALRNPKKHDQEALGKSLEAFGAIESVVMDERTGRLVAGHGRTERLAQMQAAGAEPPEGVVVDGDGRWCWLVTRGWRSDDDLHAEAAGVALNRVGERGGWHPEVLAAALDDLDGRAELDAVGWSADELDELIASTSPPEPAPDPWRNRKLRPMPDAGSFAGGQVWQIGPHRLVVGDSRDPAVWAVLPGADLLVTDPPYGIDYDGGGVERVRIEDDADPAEAAALLDAVLPRVLTQLAPGAGSYVFLPPGAALPLLLEVVDRHGLYRWSVVWAKDQATFGRADYHHQHELIAYAWAPGPRRVPVADRTLTTLWSFPRPRVSKHHPSEKPVALLTRAIEASSHPGDVVLDPFAGSGSTLVAAAKCGRVGVGVEKVPEYARVAVDRLAEVTGATPERIAGEPLLSSTT